MEAKNYTVTAETSALIDALKAFKQMEDIYFRTLAKLYGEDEAEKIRFTEESETFDNMEAVLTARIGETISRNLDWKNATGI